MTKKKSTKKKPAKTAGSVAAAAKPAGAVTGNVTTPVGIRRRERPNTQAVLNDDPFGNLPRGDMTLKTDVVQSIRLVRPPFGKGVTVFRPWSHWDYEVYNETGQQVLSKYRSTTLPNRFDADWIRSAPAAVYMGEGDNRFTFLLYNPALSETEYDRNTNPYIALYRAVRNAAKQPKYAHWEAALLKRRNNQGAIIPAPAKLYFSQGHVVQQGKEVYLPTKEKPRIPLGLAPNDPTPILQMKQSAGKSLLELANRVNPEFQDDPDMNKAMLYGDFVSPESGVFVTIYDPDTEDPAPMSELQIVDLNQALRQAQSSPTGGGTASRATTELKGFMCRVDKCLLLNKTAHQDITPAISGELLENVLKKIVWWEDILNYLSHEAMIPLIARALKGYGPVLEFAWSDLGYYTEEVRKICAAAAQVSMTGANAELTDDQRPATSVTAGSAAGVAAWTIGAAAAASVTGTADDEEGDEYDEEEYEEEDAEEEDGEEEDGEEEDAEADDEEDGEEEDAEAEEEEDGEEEEEDAEADDEEDEDAADDEEEAGEEEDAEGEEEDAEGDEEEDAGEDEEEEETEAPAPPPKTTAPSAADIARQAVEKAKARGAKRTEAPAGAAAPAATSSPKKAATTSDGKKPAKKKKKAKKA